MASRIADTFARLRGEKRTGLVTYVTAGDPDLVRSADILCALDRAGADVLEVGIPFSEPLADGPVIQRATERALAAGATASGVLELVSRIRSTVRAPIVLFTYANPVLRMGVDAFGDRAKQAGVDGVLVLDLPIEEAEGFRDALAARDIDMIFLLSPTTTDARMTEAARMASGFVYGISRLGVTGTRDRRRRRRGGAGAPHEGGDIAADRSRLRHLDAGACATDWKIRGCGGGGKRTGRGDCRGLQGRRSHRKGRIVCSLA